MYHYNNHSQNSLELVVFFVKFFIVVLGIGLIVTGIWQMSNQNNIENPITDVITCIFEISVGIVKVIVGLILVLAIISPQVLKFIVHAFLSNDHIMV
jgi:uncharacterized membrane protein YidH (DUF202 family)